MTDKGGKRRVLHVAAVSRAQLLMLADAMGAMLESSPKELGCDVQGGLAANGKESIVQERG